MKKKNQKREEEQLERKASRLFSYCFLFLFLSLAFISNAGNHFTFSTNCLKAQKLCYELQLEPAIKILEAEAKLDPENLVIPFLFHFNYTLKAFVTEEDSDYETLKAHYNSYYDLISDLDESNPYRRFAMAEMNFQFAMIKGKREEYYSAGRNINSAYRLLKSNAEEFPDFVLNKKTLGLINAYLSTVPDNYSWAVKLLGLNGNLTKGLQMLKDVAYMPNPENEMILFAQEAHYLYSFTLYHIAKKDDKGWREMQKCTNDYQSNGLSAFFRALMASRLHKNDEVIKSLVNAPSGPSYQKVYFNDYLLGLAKLNQLDVSAINHFSSYYSSFKGKNYIKACLQKMSWYYSIHQNSSKAEHYKSLISSKGQNAIEEDQIATLFISKPSPNLILLKTRLLFDGGYYQKALDLITPYKGKDFSTESEKAEYAYRKGRIYSQLGQEKVAELFYIACAKYAVNSPEYYGAYACLYLGEYYLSQHNKSEAKLYFEKALSFKQNKEYKDSIEQKAKTGLKSCR